MGALFDLLTGSLEQYYELRGIGNRDGLEAPSLSIRCAFLSYPEGEANSR